MILGMISSRPYATHLLTSHLSGLLPNLVHVLALCVGPDLLEHWRIFEDVGYHRKSDLAAPDVNLSI